MDCRVAAFMICATRLQARRPPPRRLQPTHRRRPVILASFTGSREQRFERLPLPWHVAEGTMFAVRSNLHALSTTDGSELRATGYPETEFPRITGEGSNNTLVVVSFSSQPSGGD